MAVPHLSAQFISRGSGHSAVAKAAYNARANLTAEREGETYDYTRHRSKCIFEGIYAPKNAPEWTRDRAQLWNHVEAFEKHRNAELAHEVNIALPHELTAEQNRWLLQEWIKENVTRKGLIADAVIHSPDPRGDARNIHAHVMIVMRPLDGSEFKRTKPRYDTFSEKQAVKEADLAQMRSSWGKLANKALERHGHEARIDMGRKLDGEPTVHLGKTASRLERGGVATERGDVNREVEATNDNRREWIAAREREGAAEARYRADEAAEQAEHLERLAAIRGIDDTTRREGDAEARYRTHEQEAENTPQHRQAKPHQVEARQATEPAKAPRQRDQAAADIRQALEALALTDPMRFAAAASAARETAYRPSIPGYAPPSPALPLEIERGRERERIMEPTPAAPTPKPINTAAPVKPMQFGMAVSYSLPGIPEQAKEATREPEAAPKVFRGTDLPGPTPQATQRPSYEVENQEPTPERRRFRKLEVPAASGWRENALQDSSWQERAIKASYSMIEQLAGRLGGGLEAWRDRRQADQDRKRRNRAEPQLSIPAVEMVTQDLTAENRHRVREDLGEDVQHVFEQPRQAPAPQPEPRPHMRVRSYIAPEPTRQQRESVRRQEPAHDQTPQRTAPGPTQGRGFWDDDIAEGRRIIEAERARETPQQRQEREEQERGGRERHRHHRPFLQDVLGYIRKRQYRRDHP